MGKEYETTLKEGHLNLLKLNLSPLYHSLGGKRKRFYFNVMGHFKDPFKFITQPIKSLHHKGSIISRIGYEAFTGEDWRGYAFTEFDEFMGWDTSPLAPSYKGIYKTTSRTGKYYKGQKKGGKLTRKLTKYDIRGGHHVDFGTLPSYLVHQFRQTRWVQIQNLWSMLAKEMTVPVGVGRMLGLDITATRGKSNPYSAYNMLLRGKKIFTPD